MGWEAGGGPMEIRSAGDPMVSIGAALTHFNVGMSWRPRDSGPARERLTYVAWEPWFLVGGTLGLAHSTATGGLQPWLGLWEGGAYVLGAPGRVSPLRSCSPCYTLSVALGWRWNGRGEVYVAPKFGVLNDMTVPFPFQRDAD